MPISLCDFVRPSIESVDDTLIVNVPTLVIDKDKPEVTNDLGPTTLLDANRVMRLLHDLRDGKLIASARNGLLEPRLDVPPSAWRSVKEAEIDWRRNAVPAHNLWDVEIRSPTATVDAVSADRLNGRGRRRNVHDDASLKNKLETVIKNAARSWPDKQQRPPITTMAKDLIRRKKAEDYQGDTLRKILSGTYEPAKRLGISLDW